jgi:hypothetical protein
MMPAVMCADGISRYALGPWQWYLSASYGDPEESARRLQEIPENLREAVLAHCRSQRVLHWVNEVLSCDALLARRAMIQACPEDLRPAVQDQVQVLFTLRQRKRQTTQG